MSASVFLFAPHLYAQENGASVGATGVDSTGVDSTGIGSAGADSTSADSTIKARIDSVWAEVHRYRDKGQEEKAHSLQAAFADTSFRYFKNHPDTEAGKRAAKAAFRMWANTGADEKAEEGLTHLDYDSEVWGTALRGTNYAFMRNERIGDYHDLLREVKSKLTHPKSRSVVFMDLALGYRDEGNSQKAKELFQKVVDLGAVPPMIERAKGYLYELESLAVGEKAPDFEAETAGGEKIALSDLRGEVVLLEFWASWCAPCRPEIPHLKEVWSKYRGEDFRLIGISLDKNREDMMRFIEEEGLKWPQILVEKGWEGELANLYHVETLPKAYLIDREGRIAARDFRKKEIKEEVRQLMELSEK